MENFIEEHKDLLIKITQEILRVPSVESKATDDAPLEKMLKMHF